MTRSLNVALIFTRSTSLKDWVEKGLFTREKLIYEHLLDHYDVDSFTWFTYGSEDEILANDLRMQSKLHPKVRVVSMPSIFKSKFGSFIYSVILPLINFRALRNIDIIKVNQVDGSWAGWIAGIAFQKPFLMRTGYLLSEFQMMKGKSAFKASVSMELEKLAGNFCAAWVTTTAKSKIYIESSYGVTGKKVHVVNNFLDLKRFQDYGAPREERIIYIGRLDPHKNLLNLIEAAVNTNMGLDLYGHGELESTIRDLARKHSNVSYKGFIPNDDVPTVLNRYKYFGLVSLSEGSPKVLLEAIACGCICLGTNVTGIKNLITDGVTGVLSKGLGASDIGEAISRLHSVSVSTAQEENLRLIQNYSLPSCAETEFKVYQSIL